MPQYNLEARYLIQNDLRQLDDASIDILWKLFVKIGDFWGNGGDPQLMKSNFLVFLSNRIENDYNYLSDYVNACDVIGELCEELGEEEGYKKLFTDPLANISPPVTKLARARQMVSNEFIKLQLALGGFKAFGSPLNYPGYFGGVNIEGRTPYRIYKQEK
jgi:hypothetical protein